MSKSDPCLHLCLYSSVLSSLITHHSSLIMHALTSCTLSLRRSLPEIIDPGLNGRLPVDQFIGLEEKAQFLGGGLGRIGAVNEVERVAYAKIATNRARLGL